MFRGIEGEMEGERAFRQLQMRKFRNVATKLYELFSIICDHRFAFIPVTPLFKQIRRNAK